ncbi:MAG: hypothetical protein KAV87_67780 [Desulfobacteraceae bacterium]|nr:hypothetical protein [Desulfobacteraceae bacterium]
MKVKENKVLLNRVMLILALISLLTISQVGRAYAQDPSPYAAAERCAPLTDPSANLTDEEAAALQAYCDTPPTKTKCPSPKPTP